MSTLTIRAAALAVLTALALVVRAQKVIDLAGAWDFGTGDPAKYTSYVMLPGSMLTNDKGDPVNIRTQWTGSLYDSSYYFNPFMAKYRVEGKMKFPFFLTPKRHYVGAAWYRRQVYVPQDWKNQQVTLLLERPHIETTVYVNGQEAGHCNSLSVPHRFDVTKYLKYGQQNQIAIRVYNGIENVGVGQDSHSVTDQTQGNWNGIAGHMELRAGWKKLNIKRVRIRPDSIKIGSAKRKEAVYNVEVELNNHVDGVRIFPLYDYNVTATVIQLNDKANLKPFKWTVEAVGSTIKIPMYESWLMPWDEFSPVVYKLTVEAGEEKYETIFGIRTMSVRGRQLYINDRPLYLRGTVENCCFPETGYPPTTEEEWMRVFRKCKEYGLNHVRFHSYCPPEAAFSAADQVGIYLQVEGPSWPNHGVKLRRGQVIDNYLLEESKRIVDEYGHHPSFVMMAAGNEPAGDWVAYCNDWVKQMKAYDPTKLYCGASVGGGWAWDDGSEYHVKGGARGLDWDRHAPQSTDDYYDQIEFPRNYKEKEPNRSPIVAHEQGQWCAFPDLGETDQYTGVYKARNMEIFADLLRANGMEGMAGKFLKASGRLQTLCYKYEIERNLRTPDYAGFQLLSLNDYSGQGTATVGPLNVHWREKGYTTHYEWRQFCSHLVILARFPRFVFTDGDTLRVPLEAYNAYSKPVSEVDPVYFIINDSQEIVANKSLPTCSLNVGKNNPLGTVTLPLNGLKAPGKYILTVQLSNVVQNTWEFWVYPGNEEQTDDGSPDYETDTLDQRALDILQQGGTVLITAAGKVKLGSDVSQTYLPVFWNTSWFKMRPPHTTGAYIETTHPLFSHGFPTDSWSNLNWWELLNRAKVMNLMELPADYQPPIQPIDTWHVSRKLGMLIEARVLNGRVLMTTMDISNDLNRRHVARQMRHAITKYMQSEDFQPTLTLTPETLSHFFTRQAPPVNMFTNDSPDELKPKLN